MKIIGLIIKGLILLVFLAVAVSNTQVVSFFYLPGQSIDLPLIAVLFGAFVLGVICGMFALFGRLLRLRSENNRLRAEVKKYARNVETAAPTAPAVETKAATPAAPAAPTDASAAPTAKE